MEAMSGHDSRPSVQGTSHHHCSPSNSSPIDPPSPPLVAGNAFAVMKREREVQLKTSLCKDETELPVPVGRIGRAPCAIAMNRSEGVRRPAFSRKISGLDYEEDLALPMPKIRRPRGDSPEMETLVDGVQSSPEKQSFSSDHFPARVSPTGSYESTSTTGTSDGKKMSKLQAIKSKMSFKDLKKEATKEEPPLPATPMLQPSEDTTSCRYPLKGATIMPSIASTTFPENTNSKNAQITTDPTQKEAISIKSASTAHTNPIPGKPRSTPSSKLPLAQGVLPSVKTSPHLTSEPSYPGYPSSANEEIMSSDSCQSRQLGAAITFPNRESPPRMPPPLSLPRYPLTGESPPYPDDLLEGTGKVKYIPKAWVEDPLSQTPSSKFNGEESIERTPRKREYRAGSIPSRVPTLKKQFERESTSSDGNVNTQIQSLSLEVNEVVDMVRSIQRHADLGLESISRKLEALSAWIHGQLNHHIQSITDLSRANSDLFTKQSHLSREMMNLQIAIRLEIGAIERHLNGFEMELLDELQAEVRALAKSYEELNTKTDALIQNSAESETKLFMEVQRMKNSEIESEIAYLKANPPHASASEPPALPKAPIASKSSFCSIEPLIKRIETSVKLAEASKPKPVDTDMGVLAIGLMHPPMLPPSRPPIKASTSSIKTSSALNIKDPSEPRNSGPRTSEDTLFAPFPRSASVSKKGLSKNNKPSSLDQKEDKSPISGDSHDDEPSKWNLFRFRRRHNSIESAPSSDARARSVSSPVPVKEQVGPLDDRTDRSSSESSTLPVPQAPVRLHSPGTSDTVNISSQPIHPALRTAGLGRRSSSPVRLPPVRPVRPKPPQDNLPYPISGKGGLPTLSHPPISHPFTPSASSPAAGFPFPRCEAEPSLASVPEAETKVEESDDDLEEQPLLGCNDGDPNWSYICRSETRGHENMI